MIHLERVKIDVRQVGPIPVLSPDGRLTIGAPAQALKEAFDTVLGNAPAHIILDASRVTYLDSSGIGELIAAARSLMESGGRLGICAPSPKVREILKITGLNALFVVGEGEEALAASLGPSPEQTH